MALPSVDSQKIFNSLEQFDTELRNTDEWNDWDAKKSQVYAIDYNGRKYPPKKIVSMALGIPVSEFVGGAETNDFLNKYGIKVIRLRELKINESLKLISERYETAKKTESFKGGNSIRELFDECRRVLNNSTIITRYTNLKVVTSYGKGNWATIPWISFLDTRETNTTQDGTYIVILFCEHGTGCYIKMAQGVTQPTKEHGAKAVDILHERAEKLRTKYSYLKERGFDLSGQSNLGSDQKLAKLYEASTVASKFYDVNNFPSEEQIYSDLSDLLECYNEYVQSRDPRIPPAKDSRELVLLGTWREVLSEFDTVKQAIENQGAWAFWWSFRIHPLAEKILRKPFYLYINAGNGEIPVRIKISDWQSSYNNDGIVTPWPNETPSEWQNINSLGAKQSEKFITWAKAIDIEKLQPSLSKEDFDPAPGLSSRENLLNQMVFGYAYVDSEPEIEPITVAPIEDIIKTAYVDFSNANFRLQESLILRFAASFLTKRFVVISGLSGSGKTKLAHAFASWISQFPEQCRLVAVGADWTSSENVLGYQDALQTKIYRKPSSGALDLILRAHNDKVRPYFLILDEMNLSHVERYFADILSAIESGQEIALHSATEPLGAFENDPLQVPAKIRLPENLFIVGTVNIDETTYMFSPKVLDRANVIEFRVSADEISSFLESPAKVDMDALAGKGSGYGSAFVNAAKAEVSLPGLPAEIGDGAVSAAELKHRLTELFEELTPIGAEFGFRTAFEVSRFFYHHAVLTGDGWQFKDALDAQIVQKLMPKLHGSDRKLRKVLDKLQTFCETHDLQLSLAKTKRMLERLTQDGFTSFAEA